MGIHFGRRWLPLDAVGFSYRPDVPHDEGIEVIALRLNSSAIFAHVGGLFKLLSWAVTASKAFVGQQVVLPNDLQHAQIKVFCHRGDDWWTATLTVSFF